MAKIKIISNPYEKSINYQRYDAASSSWVDINNGQYNGNLKKDYMINSFFPFIVKDVVDEVIDEFEGEKIELYFEGPSDEFSLLSDLISSEEYSGKLTLNEDSRYLDNAWEIIPDVREVFTKVDSVIRSSIADGTIMSSYVERWFCLFLLAFRFFRVLSVRGEMVLTVIIFPVCDTDSLLGRRDDSSGESR